MSATDELKKRRTARRSPDAKPRRGSPGTDGPTPPAPPAPPAGVDEPDEVVVDDQLELPGVTAGALDMRVGGGRPTSSEFRMRSIALPLGGQLQLDGKVWLLVEADVDDVGVRNHRKGRTVTARVRRHVVTPLSVRVLTADELEAFNVGEVTS